MSWGIVPTVIDRLVQQHPRLIFHVMQAAPTTLRYRELPERRIEFAIGRVEGPIPGDDVEIEVLYNEQTFVVAGRQSRWAGRRKIKLAELVDEPWSLQTPDSFARTLLTDAFQVSGLPPPRVNAVSYSMPLHNALLASGHFLSVMPGSLLQFSAALISYKVLPVELPVRLAPVGIITLKNRTPSPVAQLFIDHAREIAKPLAKRKG